MRFPSPHLADASGLLAVGGDLSIERLMLAYQLGIFPWYDEDESPILWHAPEERFVVTPERFRFGRSIKKLLSRHRFEVAYDRDFPQVVAQCARIPRAGQNGTWLGPQMVKAYCDLHDAGHAHSAEAYLDGVLVGGLYGVTLGGCFFGESMFSRAEGASKVVFATLAPQLFTLGYGVIDCQMYTEHLARFGAQSVVRSDFERLMSTHRNQRLTTSWPQAAAPSKPVG